MIIPESTYDLTMADYHAWRQPDGSPIWSASSLALYRRDKATAWERVVAGVPGPKRKRSAALKIGTAIHDDVLRQPEAPESMAALTADEKSTAMDCIAALANPWPGTWAETAKALLTRPDGRSEWSGCWAEPSGVLCKLRADRLVGLADPDEIIHGNLKTTRHATPQRFARDAEDFGYYESAAFYERGLGVIFGHVCPVRPLWIVVSTASPNRVWIREPEPERMEEARETIDRELSEIEELMQEPLTPWQRDLEPWEMAGDSIPPAEKRRIGAEKS